MVGIVAKQRLMGQDFCRITLAAEQKQPDLALVQPEMKNGIVELACETQKIGIGTLRGEGIHVRRCILAWTVNGDRCHAEATVDSYLEGAVGN